MSGPDPCSKTKDTRLSEIVFQEIEKSPEGEISFSEFIEISLYHSELGYYANPAARRIGRGGDFFTSVSVGPVFGNLLAEAILQQRHRIGADARFALVEQGAHDGQLALDVLAALRRANALDGISYRAIEPREPVRRALRDRFTEEGFRDIADAAPSVAEARSERGIFFCNELLDALPFDRIVFRGGEWRELFVTVKDGNFAWREGALRPQIVDETTLLGSEFSEGYETEVRPTLASWTEEIADLFEEGVWWVIDYGFERSDYYAPSRTRGTWRCFRDHQASEDPFSAIGETDITAHADFTRLREAAEGAGLAWQGLRDQGGFLTEAARDWLLAMDGQSPSRETAALLRQFQTLVHPGLMGRQFLVAEMRKCGNRVSRRAGHFVVEEKQRAGLR